MLSLRQTGRSSLARNLAHVLILALVAGFLPSDARASMPKPPTGIGSMAIVIFGGLATSAILNFFLLPALYLLARGRGESLGL